MAARIVSLNRSSGGVPKLPVAEAHVSASGMEGDRQHDRRHHGGPDRALCLYSLELIEQLQLEGFAIVPGAAGENVTISGLDWRLLEPGQRLRLGDVELEITGFTTPCKNLNDIFQGAGIARISQKVNPGWSRVYARVTRPGVLHVDDAVEMLAARQDFPSIESVHGKEG